MMRLGWPSRVKPPGLVTPGTVAISVLSAFDRRSSSARSRPNIFTEFSPFTPDTASSILSWMYCEKLKSTPTNSRLSCSLIWRTSSSLLRPFDHSSNGFGGRERAVGIGAVLAATLLGHHGAHRRVARDDVAHARDAVHAGFECDGGRQQRADPEISLLQLRQELRAEPRAEHAADREKAETDDRRDPVAVHGERQQDVVGLADLPHQ